MQKYRVGEKVYFIYDNLPTCGIVTGVLIHRDRYAFYEIKGITYRVEESKLFSLPSQLLEYFKVETEKLYDNS